MSISLYVTTCKLQHLTAVVH